jgi:uncharacterized protein YjbJ (UPF0337 family)
MTTSAKDKLNGTLNTTSAAVKHAVGAVTGNKKMVEKAQTQSMVGEAQKAKGAAKTTIQQGLHATGDGIEFAGEKLKATGFKIVGEAVKKIGDKIEHLAD